MPRLEWSLDRWVREVYDIYGDRNREMDSQTLWLEVVDETSKLYEEIRKGNFSDTIKEPITKLFLWICAFVGKYTLTPSDEIDHVDPVRILSQDSNKSYLRWILLKYPKVCHFCGQSKCICVLQESAIETRHEREEVDDVLKEGFKIVEDKKKEIDKLYEEYSSRGVDDLIDMFIKIYNPKISVMELGKITAHLLEEVGEVAHEICSLTVIRDSLQQLQGKDSEAQRSLEELQLFVAEELKKELADVFSWLSSFLHKLGDIWRSCQNEPDKEYLFSDLLETSPYIEKISEAEFGCHYCGKKECREDCRIERVQKEREKKLDERNRMRRRSEESD